MLFRKDTLDGIRDGRITLAFRRWRRPTVRTGGTLMVPIGQLRILQVREIAEDDITDDDARRAGYASREALREELAGRTDGTLYRIELGALGPERLLRRGFAAGHDSSGRYNHLDGRAGLMDASSARRNRVPRSRACSPQP